jgi:enamine deaminase RidA (YjgF/YER057c/UK114 family)
MSREIIRTTDAPKAPRTYSQVVKAAGLVFVSGTGPFDASGAVTGGTIQEQTQQCLKNISAILGAAGTSRAHSFKSYFFYPIWAGFRALVRSSISGGRSYSSSWGSYC